MKNIFRKIFEKSKILKSHFFRKLLKKRKNISFSKKVDFLKFSIFQNLSKNIFHRKNYRFRKIFGFIIFYRTSCITSASGIAKLPLCRPWVQ